jgi:hypothetical protein
LGEFGGLVQLALSTGIVSSFADSMRDQLDAFLTGERIRAFRLKITFMYVSEMCDEIEDKSDWNIDPEKNDFQSG